MQIDVQLADTAVAAVAAAELARALRQSASRLAAACPADDGSLPAIAWTSTWATLQASLLGLATAADNLAAASGAAGNRLQETETAAIAPDGR